MLKIGYKIIAIPLFEVNKFKEIDILNQIMADLNYYKLNYNFKVLALHTSPRNRFKADYYSSLTYYVIPNKSSFSIEQLTSLRRQKIFFYRTIAKNTSLQRKISDYIGIR